MIYGICGYIGSGKDTIGQYLLKKGYVKLSFAGVLKDVLSIMFDWEREIIEGDTEESREFRNKEDKWWSERLEIDNFTPRRCMQWIGTELFRNNFHKNIWVFIVEKKIDKLISEGKNIVITDARFKEELDLIKKYNGKIIHVKRYKPVWEKYVLNNEENKLRELGIHESEYRWYIEYKDKFDYIIDNTSSKEELYNKLDNIQL